MFTLPQLIARLTRGYIKFTGKQPDNLAKIKIQQEALQKFKDSNKVKSLQDFKDKKGIKSLPVNEQFTTKPNVEPIIKSLDDDVATAQINKLKQDFDFSDRNKVLQLLDDIDAKKAFGAFDDIQRKELRSMISDMYTRKPEFASGGLARVGMFSGGPIRLAKGASWVINKLKEQLFDLDLGIGGSRFSKLSSTQKEGFKNELKTLIKQLEQGGEIPNEMLDTMIADPKFKSVVKTRSTDKDLFELEDVLLDRQAGKQAEQIVDDVFGKGNPENQQIDMLEKFNVKDRKPNASGGIAGQLHLNEGGRVPMIFGGSLGLKALIKRMKGLNKRLFPGKIGVDKRELAKTLMPRELEQLQRLKIEQLENLLEALKLDKQQMAMRAQNKAMRDPGLDFMMKKLDEMPESGLTSEADLAKYVDIDKDILNLEQMIKNKTMKDRKPNAKGGLANILGV